MCLPVEFEVYSTGVDYRPVLYASYVLASVTRGAFFGHWH